MSYNTISGLTGIDLTITPISITSLSGSFDYLTLSNYIFIGETISGNVAGTLTTISDYKYNAWIVNPWSKCRSFYLWGGTGGGGGIDISGGNVWIRGKGIGSGNLYVSDSINDSITFENKAITISKPLILLDNVSILEATTELNSTQLPSMTPPFYINNLQWNCTISGSVYDIYNGLYLMKYSLCRNNTQSAGGYQAFKDNTTDSYVNHYISDALGYMSCYIDIELPIQLILDTYTIKHSLIANQTRRARDWTITATNDGTNWDIIDNQIEQDWNATTGIYPTYIIGNGINYNKTFYNRYRLTVTRMWSIDYFRIYYWQLNFSQEKFIINTVSYFNNKINLYDNIILPTTEITTTELSYLDGVNYSIQDQLNTLSSNIYINYQLENANINTMKTTDDYLYNYNTSLSSFVVDLYRGDGLRILNLEDKTALMSRNGAITSIFGDMVLDRLSVNYGDNYFKGITYFNGVDIYKYIASISGVVFSYNQLNNFNDANLYSYSNSISGMLWSYNKNDGFNINNLYSSVSSVSGLLWSYYKNDGFNIKNLYSSVSSVSGLLWGYHKETNARINNIDTVSQGNYLFNYTTSLSSFVIDLNRADGLRILNLEDKSTFMSRNGTTTSIFGDMVLDRLSVNYGDNYFKGTTYFNNVDIYKHFTGLSSVVFSNNQLNNFNNANLYSYSNSISGMLWSYNKNDGFNINNLYSSLSSISGIVKSYYYSDGNRLKDLEDKTQWISKVGTDTTINGTTYLNRVSVGYGDNFFSGATTMTGGLIITNGGLTISGTTTMKNSVIINNDVTRTATTGSLILNHNIGTGGSSSIVFPSKYNINSDYGYIEYKDSYDGGSNEKSLLTIGIENDSTNTANFDRISLYSSGGNGYVGVNTLTPTVSLDVAGACKVSGALTANGLITGGSINSNGNVVIGGTTSFTSSTYYSNDSITNNASLSNPYLDIYFIYGAQANTITLTNGTTNGKIITFRCDTNSFNRANKIKYSGTGLYLPNSTTNYGGGTNYITFYYSCSLIYYSSSDSWFGLYLY